MYSYSMGGDYEGRISSRDCQKERERERERESGYLFWAGRTKDDGLLLMPNSRQPTPFDAFLRREEEEEEEQEQEEEDEEEEEKER